MRAIRSPADRLIEEIVARLPDDPLAPAALEALLGKPFYAGTETVAELLKCDDPRMRAAAAQAMGDSAGAVYGHELPAHRAGRYGKTSPPAPRCDHWSIRGARKRSINSRKSSMMGREIRMNRPQALPYVAARLRAIGCEARRGCGSPCCDV